ncbi:MAG: hypothetical protein L0387_30975, partial [Acidobacteria bacterium]|nr:hypothetical protein [Acidobacteriota bacterium]
MKRIVDQNLGQRDPVFVLNTRYWPENRVRNLMIAALLRDHDPLRRHRCLIVTQTVRLRLAVNSEQGSALAETVRQYAVAFNTTAKVGWHSKTTNGVKLHRATYRSLRDDLNLPSQLVISARMKAAEALKSVRERARQGRKVGCPQTDRPAVRFDARS